MAMHSPKLFSALSLIQSNMYYQTKKCIPEILLDKVGKFRAKAAQMIKSVSNEVGANVKKTNTDFGISILNMEYVMHDMSILIPCQEPSFSDITINF